MKSNSQRLIIVLMVALGGMVEVANAFYDPGLQRWINRDPIGEAGGINLFTALNNGGHLDPLGLACQSYEEYGNTCLWHEICEPVGGFVGPIFSTRPMYHLVLPDDWAAQVDDFLFHDFGDDVIQAGINRPGAYRIKFKSGKQYIGKGPPERAAKSAKRQAKANNDTVKEKLWKPATSDLDAFIQEARMIQRAGGLGPNLYNRINSPGQRHINNKKCVQ